MLVSLLFVVFLLQGVAFADVARRAFDFQNTFGVNVHLHDGGTCYDANWNNVFSTLVASGIKHYRDGLIDTTWQPYYDRNSQLGSAGLKGTFITGWGQTASLLSQWPSRINSFEYYEGVNEPNQQGNPNWVADTMNLTKTIAMAHNPAYKVIATSITDEASRLLIGDISQYVDFGNMHDYYSSFSPGNPGWGGTDKYGTYGNMDWNINLAKINVPSKPIFSTETGWSGVAVPATHSDVPLIVQAKYILRDYLLHFNKGVYLTHLYQYCDQGVNGDGNWGLMDVNNTLKPSYYAVSGLLNLIHDSASNNATFSPSSLNVVLSGNTSNVMRTVLQKADGSFYLILWIETPDWDVNAHGTGPTDIGAPITVPPQSVVVSFSSGAFSGSYYTISLTTGKIGTPTNVQWQSGAKNTLTVNSMPSILHLTPTSA